MKNIIILTISMLIFIACSENNTLKKDEPVSDNESMALAVMYQQVSSEYKALCYQAYNFARYRLNYVEKRKNLNKPAVILDLDETVLDNSPYEVITLTENINYPECWEEWINKAEAELVPGVKYFLEICDSFGIETFYISNRRAKYMDVTIKNMKMHNLPNADSAHILLRTDEKSKDNRRKQVIDAGYDIVLLIGDNLGDFDGIFDVEDNSQRDQIVKDNLRKFGKKFIMLPNPMYGKWVENSGFYSIKNKDSLYKSILKGFECN